MQKERASTMFVRRCRNFCILPRWKCKTFKDLQDPGPIPEEGDNAYKVAIRRLDFYFRVEENISYKHHVFHQLSLQERETADQFMVSQRNKRGTAISGSSLDNNLRDQLIEKLTGLELKRKLLEQRKP